MYLLPALALEVLPLALEEQQPLPQDVTARVVQQRHLTLQLHPHHTEDMESDCLTFRVCGFNRREGRTKMTFISVGEKDGFGIEKVAKCRKIL